MHESSLVKRFFVLDVDVLLWLLGTCPGMKGAFVMKNPDYVKTTGALSVSKTFS